MRPVGPNQIPHPRRLARANRKAQPVSRDARFVAPGEARRESANRPEGTRARQAPAAADAAQVGWRVARLGDSSTQSTLLNFEISCQLLDHAHAQMVLRRMSVTGSAITAATVRPPTEAQIEMRSPHPYRGACLGGQNYAGATAMTTMNSPTQPQIPHNTKRSARNAPARSRTWIYRLGGGRLIHWTTRARGQGYRRGAD